jgi:hypothetical protein
MGFIGRIASKALPKRLFELIRFIKFPKSYASVDFATYNQDGLIAFHNCDFISDARFAQAYQAGEATGSWRGARIHWRAFVACWAADRGKSLEGDFVECGVNKGGLSKTVMEYIDFDSMSDRKFYLLDTFEGLAEKYISDAERKSGVMPGGYEECLDAVKRTFGQNRNAVIIKGTVPDTLPEVKTDKVAYLSIDMNCVEPEIAAAEFFWDKMVSGAAIILDDYGATNHIHQKRAFDEFAKRKNVMILPLPTGQGLILKP